MLPDFIRGFCSVFQQFSTWVRSSVRAVMEAAPVRRGFQSALAYSPSTALVAKSPP